ncbi:DUF1801 domain-containing protein [Paenibacillus sp. IB182496]|uniref:DUF1801 domain-containing protein n=1 Tax=Paenibacillus sabuli TaxID=2772509 RepID=A0A927GQ54_9BACL|nr:DUF1801 domain-containing protein [Paenibacillus sabuli]MBD2844008.1 DUF1801 domain-containing protein [Paenibacillus sabuli]
MNEEITTYIETLPELWKQETCAALREVVHASIPGAQERMQYKKPHFLHNGKYAAVISVAKAAVSFTIFNTAHLTVPAGFDGPPERKTVKLKQGDGVDRDGLGALLREAASTL